MVKQSTKQNQLTPPLRYKYMFVSAQQGPTQWWDEIKSVLAGQSFLDPSQFRLHFKTQESRSLVTFIVWYFLCREDPVRNKIVKILGRNLSSSYIQRVSEDQQRYCITSRQRHEETLPRTITQEKPQLPDSLNELNKAKLDRESLKKKLEQYVQSTNQQKGLMSRSLERLRSHFQETVQQLQFVKQLIHLQHCNEKQLICELQQELSQQRQTFIKEKLGLQNHIADLKQSLEAKTKEFKDKFGQKEKIITQMNSDLREANELCEIQKGLGQQLNKEFTELKDRNNELLKSNEKYIGQLKTIELKQAQALVRVKELSDTIQSLNKQIYQSKQQIKQLTDIRNKLNEQLAERELKLKQIQKQRVSREEHISLVTEQMDSLNSELKRLKQLDAEPLDDTYLNYGYLFWGKILNRRNNQKCRIAQAIEQVTNCLIYSCYILTRLPQQGIQSIKQKVREQCNIVILLRLLNKQTIAIFSKDGTEGDSGGALLVMFVQSHQTLHRVKQKGSKAALTANLNGITIGNKEIEIYPEKMVDNQKAAKWFLRITSQEQDGFFEFFGLKVKKLLNIKQDTEVEIQSIEIYKIGVKDTKRSNPIKSKGIIE